MHSMRMWPVVADVARTVCMSFCLLIASVSPTKTDDYAVYDGHGGVQAAKYTSVSDSAGGSTDLSCQNILKLTLQVQHQTSVGVWYLVVCVIRVRCPTMPCMMVTAVSRRPSTHLFNCTRCSADDCSISSRRTHFTTHSSTLTACLSTEPSER